MSEKSIGVPLNLTISEIKSRETRRAKSAISPEAALLFFSLSSSLSLSRLFLDVFISGYRRAISFRQLLRVASRADAGGGERSLRCRSNYRSATVVAASLSKSRTVRSRERPRAYHCSRVTPRGIYNEKYRGGRGGERARECARAHER